MMFESHTMAAPNPFSRIPARPVLLLGLVAIAAAVIVAAPNPMLVLGCIAVAPLMVALVVWPNAATVLVIAIIYSNAAVVAVRFHGVPMAVGAAIPLMLAAPMAYHLVLHRKRLVVDAVLPLIVLFLVIQLVSAVFSRDPLFALARVGNSAVEGLGLYFLVINVVRTPRMMRAIIWVLLGVGAFLGGLSAFQQATRTYDNQYGGFAQISNAAFKTGERNVVGEVRQRRLAGSIGEQNRYAQTMLMLAPLGFFRFRSERSGILRLAALIATGLILCGMALTFSRGAAVGFVAVVGIMVLLRYITLAQCGLVLIGIVATLMVLPQYATRLTSLVSLGGLLTDDGTGTVKAGGSLRSRYTETMAAGLMFMEHPIVGVGPGIYPEHYREYATRVGGRVKHSRRQSHTLLLGMAAELGIAGVGVFLWIVSLAFRNLVRVRRQCHRKHPELAETATGLILTLVGYLAAGLSLHFAYVRFFWLMMALAGAVAHIAMDVSHKDEEEEPCVG